MKTALCIFAILCMSGCITAREIKASIWMNNGMDPALCETTPALKDHGFYRRLNDGKIEFMSFCDPRAMHWISIYDLDLEAILGETLPKKDVSKVMDYINKLGGR